MIEQEKPVILSERLTRAYKRIPSGYLRREAGKLFCQIHHCSDEVFRQKRIGKSSVTEMECEWLEKYDPYKQPVTV
ncbi:hypothetical protein GCM10027299_09160 [Larkinella ripae]